MDEEIYEESDDETNYDNTELFKLYNQEQAKKFFEKMHRDFQESEAKYNTMNSNLSNDRIGSKFEKREKVTFYYKIYRNWMKSLKKSKKRSKTYLQGQQN